MSSRYEDLDTEIWLNYFKLLFFLFFPDIINCHLYFLYIYIFFLFLLIRKTLTWKSFKAFCTIFSEMYSFPNKPVHTLTMKITTFGQHGCTFTVHGHRGKTRCCVHSMESPHCDIKATQFAQKRCHYSQKWYLTMSDEMFTCQQRDREERSFMCLALKNRF